MRTGRPRRFTEAEEKLIVALARKVGAHEASKTLGFPRSTIRSILKRVEEVKRGA